MSRLWFFSKAFFSALEKIERRPRKADFNNSAFSNEDPSKKWEPIQKRKFSSKSRRPFRNRVHKLDVEIDEQESDIEVTKAKVTLDERDFQEDEEIVENESDADQGDEDAEAEPVVDNDARQPEFLAGVYLDPSGKRPAPWFAFANDGKCPFANCKYSHNADDIRAYIKKC